MGSDNNAKIFKGREYSAPHLGALKLIGRNKKVLDVGCSSGGLLRAVSRDLAGTVDGIEIDAAAAEIATKYARKVYVGSVEDPKIIGQIHDQYDVLLFMDVLEHVRDSLQLLKNTRHLLANEGYVVASIPNVANWRLRLSLLFGRFDYQESGLLDKGHLRFFTLKTIRELFKTAGYQITYLDFSLGGAPPILESTSKSTKNIIKALFKKLIGFWPELFANQFIIKAEKIF